MFGQLEEENYQIQNKSFQRTVSEGFWNLEGKPKSYRKSRVALGKRDLEAYSEFMIYDKGNGYLIQVQFGDGTWCNVTVEDTFKKEGAQIYLENRHVKGDNKLFHTQRFRIEEKRHGGYYIRSMDGRFLRYDYKKREVNSTATRPGDYSNDQEEQAFTWYILTSRRRSWMD